MKKAKKKIAHTGVPLLYADSLFIHFAVWRIFVKIQ